MNEIIKPLRRPDIPFARPLIGRAEEKAVLDVLRSGWITTGKEALAFEQEFAQFLNTSSATDTLNCLAVNSATAGLHLAYEALGVGKDSLVFVPTMTFTATAEAVRYLGGEVVFVDSLKDSPHMDVQDLEKKILAILEGRNPYQLEKPIGPKLAGKKPRAICAVHYGGLAQDMPKLLSIARQYGLFLVEDAAHSFPSYIDNLGYAGSLGDIGVFSFYATKTITSAEGGMIVCKDKAHAARMSTMRLHGIDRPVWQRYSKTTVSWDYDVVDAGYKYNLTDIAAALGRVQLSRAKDLLKMRENIAREYDQALSLLPEIKIPLTGPGDARHLYPIQIDVNTSCTRNGLAQFLQSKGIGVSVHFRPLHRMSYWKQRYQLKDADLPRATALHEGLLSLPIWPGLRAKELAYIISCIKEGLRAKYE